jgi:hypothetical protein
VRAYGTVAGEFLALTGTRGGLAGLDAGVIDAFVATLAGYQAKTVEHKLCAVRSLLRFTAADGLVDGAVLEAVPAAKSSRQARIPSIWDHGTAVEAGASDLPCPVEWHPGFRLAVTELRRHPDYRGPEYVEFGARIAVSGHLTPQIIGAASRTGHHDEQALKRVWHCKEGDHHRGRGWSGPGWGRAPGLGE